jgi:hypothetical protein
MPLNRPRKVRRRVPFILRFPCAFYDTHFPVWLRKLGISDAQKCHLRPLFARGAEGHLWLKSHHDGAPACVWPVCDCRAGCGPVLNGIDSAQKPDPQPLARADVAVATWTHDDERGGREKPRRGRILPDLLSAAREEERAREAQPLDGRRLPKSPRTSARPKAAHPVAVPPEEPARPCRHRNDARAVEGQGETIPLRPEMAASVAAAVPGVRPAPVSAKPSGAGGGQTGGRLRRKVKRVGEAIPLRAGERWKRRLPPVCR